MDFFRTGGEGVNPKSTLLKKCGFYRGGGGAFGPISDYEQVILFYILILCRALLIEHFKEMLLAGINFILQF